MFFEEEAVTEADVFIFEFHTDHQAFSTVFLQSFISVECIFKVFPDAGGILYKMIVLNDIKYGSVDFAESFEEFSKKYAL